MLFEALGPLDLGAYWDGRSPGQCLLTGHGKLLAGRTLHWTATNERMFIGCVVTRNNCPRHIIPSNTYLQFLEYSR